MMSPMPSSLKLLVALIVFSTAVSFLDTTRVRAQEEQPPRAWLTFTHGKGEDNYQVTIRGDHVFNVDNHFLITDPPRLVVDIGEARIKKNIYLTIDQPELTMIRAANREKRVRVVLDLPLESTPQYQLVERNNRVTITLSNNSRTLPQNTSLKDGHVSIHLHKAELADFFAIISKTAGKTILVDESIKTPLSLRFVDISWQDALAQVLKLYHLNIEERDHVWYVSKPE